MQLSTIIFDLGGVVLSHPKQITPEVLEQYKNEYLKLATVNESVIRLIKQLKESYRVVLSTNTQDIHHKLNKERGLLDNFGRIYASWVIGLVKPTRKYFEYILKDLRISSENCMFIDDKEENIRVAKDIGMQVYLFDSTNGLINYLEKKRII